MDLIQTLLRGFFFFFDKIIYGFVGTVYNLLIDIAETSIFTEEIIDLFASRVYALLGIFMLFKVSFSILTYIVNPDDFTDKNKGFSKLITNIVITLTLLVATPWVFNQAMEVQRIILRDNVIGKIFVGIGENGNTVTSTNPGMLMGYETLKAFYYLDTDLYAECTGISSDSPVKADECAKNAFGFDNSSNEWFTKYQETLTFAEKTKSVDMYLDYDLIMNKNKQGQFTMNYIPGISTICGGALVLLLVVFCFDIAVRSVKLGFLRMIAPIPIVSRIDPKKGKEVFDKWMKTTISTYLDLFIRLIAIYFAVFVVSNIINLQIVDAVTGLPKAVNPFVIVFIILGALLFAKQLPKLIEDLTGMKLGGKFTLNPLKKLAEVPIAGKAANLAMGTADSMLHGNGFMAGLKRNWNNVPMSGGDGKKSIFDTADRKLRKDVNEKRDTAKQKYEGKKSFDDINENWTHGDKIRKRLEQAVAGQVDDKGDQISWKDAFDGKTTSNYSSVFGESRFIASKMAFDKQDAKNKEMSKLLETMRANPGKRADQIFNVEKLKQLGLADDSGKGKFEFEDIYEAADKSSKTLKGLESVHETMRKQYKDDADKEDAFKFRKYNELDPTDTRH